jgi:hypothetical protein
MPDGGTNPKKKKELDSVSEWVKSIRDILKSLIKHVRSKMRTIYPSAFHKPEVIKELNRLHEEYVLVPADKACNNIVFVRLTIISLLLTNWALILQFVIVFTLQQLFPKMKFFKTMHPFQILLIFLAMLMMIMNTSTGTPHFI